MNDDNLDLLDLGDESTLDSLPEASPFASPRPKKPWLLMTVGLVVIVLATYVIIRTIGGDSSSSIEVDLDAPAVVVDGQQGVPVDMNVMPPAPNQVQVAPQPVAQPQPQPQPVAQPVAKPQPVAQPQPAQQTAGVPVRVVEERKEVTFNPNAETPKPVAKPTPKPQPKPVAKKPAVQKTASSAPAGSWYVQFGSYSTRALAENAQRQIRNAHPSLFQGKQFVILAAQLKNGTTTYRLRVAFKTSADANGFCRNAKSDGLDCYVAK